MTATTRMCVRAIGATLRRRRRPAGGPANRQRERLDKAIVSDRRVWRRPGEGRVWRHMFALLVLVLTLNDGAGAADPVLAPTGTLRAVYIVSNIAQARLDSSTGAITGVVADIARELARREAVQWLHDGTVVAFAGGRQRLTSGTQNVRGLRLLDDNFYGVPQTIAVPLDRADRLQLVNVAFDELRANGFLADSVARSGAEGLTVAPAEMPSR